VAGAGDVIKGAEALQGVSIPMFSAKGLAIKRANGEVVTPFYFAYEDLRDDWVKLVEQSEAMEADGETKSSKKIAAKPKVSSKHIRSFRLCSGCGSLCVILSNPLYPIASHSIFCPVQSFFFEWMKIFTANFS
jgi:hypothetical protein